MASWLRLPPRKLFFREPYRFAATILQFLHRRQYRARPRVCNPFSTSVILFASMAADLPADQRLVKSKKTQRYEKQWNQQKQREQRAKSLERNQTRQWKTGDAYSPHDLSPSEMRKWRKRSSPATDAFDVLGLDPLHQYKVSPVQLLFLRGYY